MFCDLEKVIVAVIEDGFNYDLPQYSDRVLIGWDFIENDPFPYPPHSPFENASDVHGTMVSSIYLSDKNVNLLPLKVGIESDIGQASHFKDFRTEEEVQKRIDSAMAMAIVNKARIINFSFVDHNSAFDLNLYKMVEKYARENPETIFLLAAGNSKQNLDSPFETATTFRKGSTQLSSLDNVWQIPSVRNNGKLSSFSSYGKESTNVAAQGEDVTLIDKKGKEISSAGTSFATPNLGVLIARMLAIRPSMSAREIKQFIMDYSTFDKSLVGKVKSNSYIDPDLIIKKLEEYNLEHPETERPERPSFCDFLNFGCEKNF